MSDLAKRFGSAPVVNMPSDERGWRIIGFKVPEVGELLCTPVDALRELRALALVREAAAVPAPTPSEQRANAKPQDEAEKNADLGDITRHGMNCGHFIGSCDCGFKWRIALATEREMHAAWRKRAEEAEADAATERASARQEAMEEAFAGWTFDDRGNGVVFVQAPSGLVRSVIGSEFSDGDKILREAILTVLRIRSLSHPEAKAEDAPPDPLDKPVRDWRKVRVTAGMLCEAIQIAQNVPSGQIASATRFRRAVEAVATDALDRSASLHTGER